MAFDLATAKPEAVSGGFDISTASVEVDSQVEPQQVERPAYMDQLEQMDQQFYQQAGITTPEQAKAVQNSKEFVLRGLPEDVQANLLKEWSPEPKVIAPASPYAPVQPSTVDPNDFSRIREKADMERLRLVNPYLVEDIESRGALKTGVIGAGEKVDAALRGAGELVGMGTGRDEAEQLFAKALKSRPAAKVGGAATEVAALAVPGGAAQRIPQLAGRMATQGAITGTEQGLTALGEGKSGKEAAIQAGTGFIAGGAFGALPAAPKKNFMTQTMRSYFDDIGRSAKNTVDPVEATPPKAIQPLETPPKIGSKAEIRQAIQDGTVEAAGWRVGRGGKIEKDGLQNKLLKSGVDERLISQLNLATDSDKKAGIEMLKKARAFVRGEAGSVTDRPQTVIGNSAMKRFRGLSEKQAEASKKIGQAVDDDLDGVPVDITDELNTYKQQLEDLGVKFDGGKIDFKESGILGSATGPLKRVFNMSKPQYGSAKQLHELKKNISKQMTFDSPVGKKLDVDAERALTKFRSSINKKLRGMSKPYAAANDEFSAIGGVFEPFTKNLGRRFDPESDRVESFVGKELRKVLTNYAKGDDLINDINQLDSMARNFGLNFDDDIMKQVMLNNELERVVGSFAPGGAQSIVERGASAALDTMTPNAVGAPLKAGVKALKDATSTPRPSKDKLQLIQQLIEYYSRGINK